MSQTAVSEGVGAQRYIARRRPGSGEGQLGTAAVLLGVWLLLIFGTGLLKPAFLGVDTFTAISYTAVGLAPICIGLAVVTISGGGLDLSGGIVASVSAMCCASLLTNGWSTAAVIGVVLLLGFAIGAGNGLLVAWAGLDPIVTTLGTSFVGIGLVELQSSALSMPAETPLRSFSFGRPLGVTNLAWVALAVLLVVEVFLRRTRGGRHVVALGGNAVAAVRLGISRGRIRFWTFVFSGACAALAGLMIAGSSDVVQAELTSTRQFQVVSAVLLAGIAIAGGRGRLLALVVSVLVVATIPTVLATLGASSAWSMVLQGCVLGIALAIDGLRARRRATA